MFKTLTSQIVRSHFFQPVLSN
uniref:Uncharacterized protein n=1 Tax=Arundo donax TaxID=35708 RepID=A0A0A8ZHL0_ARUDO